MTARPRRLPLLAALVASAALGALAGCSDAVDPTLGTDQAFSVYGYLDPTADRQALRVVPIAETLGADTLRTIDAEVTSVERETGRTAAWRDSVVAYADGSVGHVFVADYTPTAGATVVVTVSETGGEGRTAAVEVTVPALARPDVSAPDFSTGDVTYPVRLAAPRVLVTELIYYVTGLPGAPADTVAVKYGGVAPLAEAGGGTWALDLDFVATSRAFLASREVGGARLALVDVAVRAFVADAAWTVPDGGFDEDEIVEPGTFSNVGGGFGFVGAGYWTERRWVPSLVTQSRAGFEVLEDPAALLFINEVSQGGWVELYNPTLEAIPIAGYSVVAGSAEAVLPAGTTVPAGAFFVVELGAPPDGDLIVLRSASGRPATQVSLPSLPEAELGTYGSYPDGRSRGLGELPAWREYDLFRGLMAPTPGAPNQVTPLAAVNEVYAAGPNGWTELYALPGISEARVTSNPDLPVGQWRPVVFDAGPFGVASETTGRLDLEQVGGEIAVVVWLRDNPPRVFDVRSYGPQTQGRSSGLLPDGDRTGWQADLLPTRGAPNAAARFAQR